MNTSPEEGRRESHVLTRESEWSPLCPPATSNSRGTIREGGSGGDNEKCEIRKTFSQMRGDKKIFGDLVSVLVDLQIKED